MTGTKGEQSRSPAIDALRGIAASAVLVFHFHGVLTAYGERSYLPRALEWLAQHGDLGVEVFFVISGFVIALSIGDARVTPAFLGRFAVRRSMRLDPVYWSVVTIAFATTILIPVVLGRAPAKDASVGDYVLNLLYLDNLTGARSLVAVGWTLCLEVQFYLFFVVSLGVAQRLERHVGRAGVVVAFAPVAAWGLLVHAQLAPNPNTGLFLAHWHMFLVGALVAAAVRGRAPHVVVAVVAALVVVLGVALGDPRDVVVGGAGLLIVALGATGALGTVGRGPVLQFLGRVSYPLYLLHPMIGHRVLRLAEGRLGHVPSTLEAAALFGIATAATLVGVVIVHVALERPSLAAAQAYRRGTFGDALRAARADLARTVTSSPFSWTSPRRRPPASPEAI